MSLSLINATLFIGDGRVLEPGYVEVDQDRIVKVGRGSPGKKKGEVMDLGGLVLCPGFIDCHVHLCFDGGPDPERAALGKSLPALTLAAAAHAGQTLLAGVTTVRDMGGPEGIVQGIREAVALGIVQGPRILASGRMICMTGGHGWHLGGLEADGPDSVRKAVREQLKAGADWIKLMATGGVMTPRSQPGATQLTEEELRAGVEEARKAGRRTAVHAQGETGTLNSLRAGVDTIEHGVFLTQEAVEMMKARGRALVPTLSAPHNILGHADQGVPREAVEKTRRVVKIHLASLELAREAGVLIGAGTDAGTPFNRHGRNLAEIVRLAENGFGALEALKSATHDAARVLGLEDRIGLLAPGYEADLVALAGDPLSRIGTLEEAGAVRLVIRSGKVIRDRRAG